ncbi:MAG: TlpA family protein disulfide reductase [Hamadaea sp.]|nr:TlpA family protein disulfide reductase [Hamadaea sp.]NUT02486.1 TlpA family protein disulfide reductase [Hamadaea sp.]
MTLLAVAVVITAVLCVFSLLLNFGVIRRLREHTEMLTKLTNRSDAAGGVMHPAGTKLPALTATTAEGAQINVGEAGRSTLVGFFTPSCPACAERLPEFVALAAQMPGGSDDVVAVAVGDLQETADLRAKLAGAARVVAEVDQGPVGRAFGVQGYPAFAVLDSSTIVFSGFDLHGVPLPEAV